MIKKFVLNYIRKNAGEWDGKFMTEVMQACHEARQNSWDEQTIPGRIYDVFNACTKGMTKTSLCKSIVDSHELRVTVSNGIDAEVREVLQLVKRS